MDGTTDIDSLDLCSKSILVEQADDTCCSEWNDFVGRSSNTTFFHRWEWGDVIHQVYDYETLRLVARCNDEIVGVAPFTDVRSSFFGRSLISTAFTVGGGIAADDLNVAFALGGAAIEAGRVRKAQYVEMRSERAQLTDWETKDATYAGFRKTLPVDRDARLSAIPRKRRAEVRKALKLQEEGRLNIRFGKNVDAFYKIYAQSVRDLGTPVFPKRYAQALMDTFGDAAEIAIVEGDGAPIAALFSFYFKDCVMPYYVGAIGAARPLKAFDFLYWSLMERAAEKGASVFDFGRSKIGTPHFDYKKLWGFEPQPLAYQYALINAAAVPDVNPNNPKFKFFSSAWKRLPMPIANLAGPVLARNLA